MAMTGIRSYLKQKGINEKDIVYDPATKTVKVQGFDYGPAKPTYQTQYQSQALSDLTRNYVPKRVQTGAVADTAQLDDAFQRQGIQQADQKRQQAMTNYENLLSRPYQQGQFTYNQAKDPAYQAALQSAQMNIRDAQVRNMGDMQRRGILNSSITTDRADQIAADEMARIATQVAPQLESQAYNRFMQQEQQKYNSWQDMVKLANSRLDLAQGVFNERNTSYQNARKEREARAMAERELLQRQAEAQAKAQQAADEARMKQADSDREYNLKVDKFKFDKEQANKPKLTAGAGGSVSGTGSGASTGAMTASGFNIDGVKKIVDTINKSAYVKKSDSDIFGGGTYTPTDKKAVKRLIDKSTQNGQYRKYLYEQYGIGVNWDGKRESWMNPANADVSRQEIAQYVVSKYPSDQQRAVLEEMLIWYGLK